VDEYRVDETARGSAWNAVGAAVRAGGRHLLNGLILLGHGQAGVYCPTVAVSAEDVIGGLHRARAAERRQERIVAGRPHRDAPTWGSLVPEPAEA
jgi:hypothetical protein